MATALKTARTLQAPAVNAADATTVGAVLDLRTAFGAVLTAKLSNVGTATTIGPSFVVEISTDGTNWREFSRQTAPTASGIVTVFTVELPAPVMYARPTFTGNTGQGVNIECLAHELTSIG